MVGGGIPLETQSRLTGLWRITERSVGPLVRMDGGTAEVQRACFYPWKHFTTENEEPGNLKKVKRDFAAACN